MAAATIVHGGDFTIRGGAADGSVGDKMGWAIKQAYMRRLPFVRLLDATGGSVRTFETMGRTYLSTNDRTAEVELMQMVPVVSMVLGRSRACRRCRRRCAISTSW